MLRSVTVLYTFNSDSMFLRRLSIRRVPVSYRVQCSASPHLSCRLLSGRSSYLQLTLAYLGSPPVASSYCEAQTMRCAQCRKNRREIYYRQIRLYNTRCGIGGDWMQCINEAHPKICLLTGTVLMPVEAAE